MPYGKKKTIIIIVVLVIIILNMINYAINHDVIHDYIQAYINQKEYDDIEIQQHNSSIASYISVAADNR